MALEKATQAAVSAIKSGGDLMSAAFGGAGASGKDAHANGTDTTDPSNPDRDYDPDAAEDYTGLEEPGNESIELDDPDAEKTTIDAGEMDDSDTEDPSDEESDDEDSEESAQDGDEDDSDTEVIQITDEEGRRDYTINFKDRESIRKAFKQAAGVRKVLKQNEGLKSQVSELTAFKDGASEKAENFERLSEAWSKDGIRGLVAALTHGKQSWDDVYEMERQHREQLSKMSPEQRAAYDEKVAREEAERARKASDDRVKEIERKLQEKEERAERATLQSYMEPAFNRFRFDGKLDDPVREAELDELLWDGVRAQLQRLPEDTELTAELIRKTFARKARALNETIERGVRKETKKVMKQKKTEAKEQAQARMVSSKRGPSSKEKEVRRAWRNGNPVSAVIAALRG